MKRNIFGVILIFFGVFTFVTATTLFAASAQGDDEYISETSAAEMTEKPESKVYKGDYYLNGDREKEFVSLTDNVIVFSDGTAEEYTFTVWKNMPETDEASGYINYVDYCFLKIGEEKVSYNPASKEIILDNTVYRMAE